MAEFPALNLWTDAYLADTRHLSTVEHGAYFLLLIEAWRRPNCDLPGDDAIIARLAGLTVEEWAAIRATVLAFWDYDGRSKTYRQKRLSKERQYARDRSNVQRDNSRKRWNVKKNDDPMGMPNLSHGNPPTTTTTTTTTEEGNVAPKPSESARAETNGAAKNYAFAGRVIKLNRADYDQWHETFHAIPDFKAELASLDAWYASPDLPEAQRKKWFQGVSGALNRKHQELVAAAARAERAETEFNSPA